MRVERVDSEVWPRVLADGVLDEFRLPTLGGAKMSALGGYVGISKKKRLRG